jgi:hypothetical protein
MMRGRMKRTLGLGLTAAIVSLAVSACEEGEEQTGDDCLSNEEYFQENIYAPILATNCAMCHNSGGQAKDTSFIIQPPEWGPDYIEQNLEMFTQLSKLEYDGKPWILLKPTMQIEHEGEKRFDVGSDEYKAFEGMIDRIANPVVCDDSDAVEEFFEGVEMLDEVATLRKATLALAGRLPTVEEEQWVRDNSWEGLDQVLDNVMLEPAFHDRLREIYNDNFLTDRYYRNTDAIDLLDTETDYPNAYWFDSLPEGTQRDNAASAANRALAREGIELLVHIVKNDRPYTELLTADYTMANWYSAQTLGVDPPPEAVEGDYEAFGPVRVPGIPHAGVLTATTYLNRFPTTDTNRNRHRSRMLYEFFLATDVQALGSRPIDATKVEGVNPTLNNPTCTNCHEVVDPVAGGFQNWDAMGRYRPPEQGWHPDMKQAGFGEEVLPAEKSQRALEWLASQVIQDNRFQISAVHIMFEGLSGQTAIKEPDDPTVEGYLETIKAAKVQRQVFSEIAQRFVDSSYNLKTVVKEIIKSPYYRAYNAVGLDRSRELELAEVGMGRLLIPEQLNRKIVAATGYPWGQPPSDDFEGRELLTDMDNGYLLLYGGIDSVDTVERITEPNGIMANVVKRMANEMSCTAVPQDFAKPSAERRLFPLVEPNFQPEDGNGFEIPASASAIRANIQYLVQRMWGEYLDINDPEIDRIFGLYVEVWKDGQAGLRIPEGEEGSYGTGLGCRAEQDYWTGDALANPVTDDPNYTIRAWMAVMTYMLSDFRFVTE